MIVARVVEQSGPDHAFRKMTPASASAWMFGVAPCSGGGLIPDFTSPYAPNRSTPVSSITIRTTLRSAGFAAREAIGPTQPQSAIARARLPRRTRDAPIEAPYCRRSHPIIRGAWHGETLAQRWTCQAASLRAAFSRMSAKNS